MIATTIISSMRVKPLCNFFMLAPARNGRSPHVGAASSIPWWKLANREHDRLLEDISWQGTSPICHAGPAPCTPASPAAGGRCVLGDGGVAGPHRRLAGPAWH